MDTTDPEIVFDEAGVCNHCLTFSEMTMRDWFPNEEGARRLAKIVERIKLAGAGRPYDCVLGLSGGVDSSYLALKASQWGLRPLVVHVDAGWNSELAVANIEKTVKHCNYDLHTLVVDWEEMRDLHLAYLRAGVANQDVPQDHVIFASLYHFAIRNGIRYILSGGNIATESIFPRAWHGSSMDAINLKAIHKKYGEKPLKQYQTISFFQTYLWYPIAKKMRTVRPLNYIPYCKTNAVTELESTIGWRFYGSKHGESLFTKFFQNYYLTTKFGYDKRRPHLSSLIVSGEMSRDEALADLEKPLYDPNELEADITYFCKKLRITRTQFVDLMTVPSQDYTNFANWNGRYRTLKRVQKVFENALGRRVQIYS
jgi:N-acetyl sugar amidotransferase